MPRSKERINRLTSASLDIENCLRFLDELMNHKYGSTLYEALLVSAVIFYARPFSQNEKKGSPHLSEPRVPNSVLSGLSQDESKFHENIVTLEIRPLHMRSGATIRPGLVIVALLRLYHSQYGGIFRAALSWLSSEVWHAKFGLPFSMNRPMS